MSEEKEATIGAAIKEAGSSKKTKTGSWRTFRPVVDKEKCTLCGLCEIYCPEGCISVDRDKKEHRIDYDYCKGCGICANECKFKAIRMERDEK